MASPTATSALTFLPRGAIIQNFNIANKNIVLGFPTQDDYVKRNTPHFGETIGRVANRLANAVVHLNGHECALDKNDGPNCIHGGLMGWGTKDFKRTQESRDGKDAIKFTYTSHDGDGKFPGTVDVTVWYIESQKGENPKKTVLTIEYEVSAKNMECEETAVNLTNHSYFNLSGKPTIEGTKSKLCTRRYLPINVNNIPTGAIDDFPIDVTKEFELQEATPVIDNCFVLKSTTDPSKVPLDTRKHPLDLLGSFHHPESGIHIEVSSTEPAFQFYTGDHIDVPRNPSYGPRAGFCVEPGRFINAVNQPAWRGMSLLKKGEIYGCKIVYEAWKV